MEEIKLPIKSIVGAFCTGWGVVNLMTPFFIGTNHVWLYIVGGILCIVGIILLVLDIRTYRIRKRLLALPESVDKSKVAWGLWHTGAQVSDSSLMVQGTSIKRVLLFDYCNRNKLSDMVDKGDLHSRESDVINQNRTLTEKALLLKDEGVEVRWYSEPMPYSISIFEPINNKVTCVEDFSDKAWIHGQFRLAKVRRDKRPPFLLQRQSKTRAEQEAFVYYVKEYQKIWDKARPIDSLEDMQYTKNG